MNFRFRLDWFKGWPHFDSSASGSKYGKQPSDDGYSDQDCIEIRNRFRFPTKGIGDTGEHYFWNDIFCNATNRFICQIGDWRDALPKGSISSNGFASNEKFSENCVDKTIELTKYHPWDTVVSPHYPDPYPNNYSCTILVKTEKDYLIELMFTDFLLEEGGQHCVYDFVEITFSEITNLTKEANRENEERIRNSQRKKSMKYCGDWMAKIKLLRVVSDNIKIRFKTDDSHTYRGFRAEFTAFPKATFVREVMERKALCDNEKFKYFRNSCFLISSFPEVSWQTANRICGDIDSEMVSVENIADEQKLFSLLRMDAFHMKSDDLSRSTRAFWLQNVDSYLIRQQLKNVEIDSHTSDYDWSEDEQSTTQKYPDTKKLKSADQTCVIITLDPVVKKTFTYNYLNCYKKAGYVCIKKSLGLLKSENRIIENEEFGTITSPNFPNNYINNLEYNVTIKSSDANSVILLWFEALDIEQQNDCLYDYLMMKESFKTERICGQIENSNNLSLFTYISRENVLSLLFHTDFSNRGLGFKANWQIIAMKWCRRNETVEYISKDGVIESPGYPHWSLPSLDCSITLVAEKDKKILLTLIDFDVGEAKKTFKVEKCENALLANSDYVRIAVDHHKHINLCGSTSTNGAIVGEQYLTFGRVLTLQYKTGERNFRTSLVKRRGFRFKFKVVSKQEAIITVLHLKKNSVGSINNLNYPHLTPAGFENIIYVRSEIGFNVEMRSSKTTPFTFKDVICSSDDNHVLNVKVMDMFGNTSLQPATPNSWFACGVSQQNLAPLMANKVTEASHRHSIRSTFHVLTMTPSLTSNTIFQFLYKVKKDVNLRNMTIYLPKEYPVDSCVYDPCSENGKCVQKKLRDKLVDICECSMHYTGLFCHLTLCDLNPCGTYGVCKLVPKENDFTCHCNPGYTGKLCTDTVSTCDRTNPCGDRGQCSLINGTPRCKCNPWYEGKYCERFRVRIQYKPLSQRMLEEPFWLGLITVAVVLALICLVYCLKKKFAERIEKFFAEEIERSKTQSFGVIETGSAPRYSLTSNVGVSLNVTPMHNSPPMPRSRSSIIGRLCKHGIRSTPGHLSDSEVVHQNDDFSDNESPMNKTPRRRFPSLMFFSQRSMLSSSFNLNNSQEKEETSKILASLVSSKLSKEENRMSLDDFFKMSEAKIRQKRLNTMSRLAYSDTEKQSPSDTETSFTSQREMRNVPSIAEFHVITENSHEEEDSIGSATLDSLPNLLKQESEAETLLSNIQQIQRLSRSRCSINKTEDGSHSPHPRLVRSLSPRRPPSGFSSSTNSSSASTDNSPNHCPLPEITITQATVESFDREENEETLVCEEYEDDEQETMKAKVLTPDILSIPGEGFPVRRLSAPNPALSAEQKEIVSSPSSHSYDSPAFKKYSQPLSLRKYSLELSIPKITINSGPHGFGDNDKFESPPQSAKEMKPGASFQTLSIMHSSCDRTISESNLSTSGYSSLSSPGISRCNSSSPIPDEMATINPHLQTFTIPEAPDEICLQTKEFNPDYKMKQKSSFGNFLTIPVIAYPMHRPLSPKRKSTKEEKRSLEKLNLNDEEIELKTYKGQPKKVQSLNLSSKRDRLIAMRHQYKTISPGSEHLQMRTENSSGRSSPSKVAVDGDHFGTSFEESFYREKGKIQRNPSWPSYLKTTSSDSEDTDAFSARSASRLSDTKRKPIRKSLSKSHSLCSSVIQVPTVQKSKKSSRSRQRALSELAKYESVDRSSSSAKTSSSKELEKYSSSDSLLSLNDENLITIRSAKSLNRLHGSTQSVNQLHRRSTRFRRANSELVYYTEDNDYDGDDTDQETPERESAALSRSYPGLIYLEQQRQSPKKVDDKRLRWKRSFCRSVPVSPSIECLYGVGGNVANSAETIRITLDHIDSKSDFGLDFDTLPENIDKDTLKSSPPEEDTTSDEAGSERTVLLRRSHTVEEGIN